MNLSKIASYLNGLARQGKRLHFVDGNVWKSTDSNPNFLTPHASTPWSETYHHYVQSGPLSKREELVWVFDAFYCRLVFMTLTKDFIRRLVSSGSDDANL